MLGVSYQDHKMKEYNVQQENILAKCQEMYCQSASVANYSGWAFGHVYRHDTLSKKIVPQEIMEGGRKQEDRVNPTDIKEWTGQSLSSLLHSTYDKNIWANNTVQAFVGVTQRCPGVFGI